jgi:hypothetical protein
MRDARLLRETKTPKAEWLLVFSDSIPERLFSSTAPMGKLFLGNQAK